MLAVGILATALLAVVAAFTGAISLNSKSVEITVATEVGREFLESVKQTGYDFVPEGSYEFDGRSNDPPDSQGFPPFPYPAKTVNGRDYTLRVQVLPKGATLKVVLVEVFWGNQSRVTLETFLYPTN